MQDRDAGVKLQDVTLKTTQIKKCFSGSDTHATTHTCMHATHVHVHTHARTHIQTNTHTHTDVFINCLGEAAVDWLISWYFAKDRVEAISLAREMLCMFVSLLCSGRYITNYIRLFYASYRIAKALMILIL